jgi:FHS family L-fucose permease-like MFS transporter
MRGLGRHSKRGSGVIIAGVAGGAVVTPLTGRAADLSGTATAMAVPFAFFFVPLSYAICVNFAPAYRVVCDRMGAAEVGIEHTGSRDEESAASGGEGEKRAAEVMHEERKTGEASKL